MTRELTHRRHYRNRAPAPAGRMGGFRPSAFTVLYVVSAFAAILAFVFLGETAIYLPTFLNVTLLFICFALARKIGSAPARMIMYFWCGWFVIGSFAIFLVNVFPTPRNYFIDVETANFYYLSASLIAILGILAFESMFPQGPAARNGPAAAAPNSISFALLLIFPFLYLLSISQGTGDIPIFSGRDLSRQMYLEDYGFFYRFGIYVCVSMVLLWSMLLRDVRPPFALPRPVLAAVLILFAVIAVSDGRRVFLVVPLMGMLIYYMSRANVRISWARVGALAALALGAYLMVHYARALGSYERLASPLEAMMPIGVEYRDYAYTFATISRDQILLSGYDWFGSSLRTLLPSFLLGLAGIDKAAIGGTDSAATLMDFFDVQLGIRIGLPGEIWLSYGWPGLLVFVPIGVLIAAVSRRIDRSRDPVSRSIWIVVAAIFALAVLGQSTVTFGLLLPLAYLGLLNLALRKVFPGGSAPPPAIVRRRSRAPRAQLPKDDPLEGRGRSGP